MAAHTPISKSLLGLARSFQRLNAADPLTQCLAPRFARTFATQTELPVVELAEQEAADSSHTFPAQTDHLPSTVEPGQVLTTLHSWPTMEPKGFSYYHSKHLDMPLRRDILHRAVVFEADASRQGSASTKYRTEVHGSNRKIRPQKGTGQARLGDKKSPMLRGGGVAFGPKPRDFSTELQKKVYDIAWRTALSYRYRKGELIVLENMVSTPPGAGPRFLHNVFEANGWGKANGRSLIVTQDMKKSLFESMEAVGEHGSIKDIKDVDVKDLLETGRVIIESKALRTILRQHSSDLAGEVRPNVVKPAIG